MSLKSWLDNRWLEVHEATSREIADLLAVADRSLSDAAIDALSADARVGSAYTAALAIGAAALAAEGYRAMRDRHHERVLDSLIHTLGVEQAVVHRLHGIRRLRNSMTYERIGLVTEPESRQHVAEVATLRAKLVVWLNRHHPDLMQPSKS